MKVDRLLLKKMAENRRRRKHQAAKPAFFASALSRFARYGVLKDNAFHPCALSQRCARKRLTSIFAFG